MDAAATLRDARRRAGLTQAELAQNLDLTPMAVATLVDRMEAAGWITRRPSETDRRANAIELQPRAEAALEKAVAVSDRVQESALAGFSAAERKQLVAMLQRDVKDGLDKAQILIAVPRQAGATRNESQSKITAPPPA